MSYRSLLKTVSAGALLSLAATLPAQAATWHTGAGSIDGSLCVGFDCPSTPAFGFDTIRLQENNLRIHFDDTSAAAAFPPNDWRLYANDSANGGDSYFGVEDATAGRFVFRVFAGARSNALTIDSQGDVGLGTTTPALDIDIKTGDTPSIRLQQDGTSGFTPQTWDVAGNEVGFFVRDATNGSTLPFRVLVGAPSQALLIDGDGDVGIGTGTNPDQPLHIRRTGGAVASRILVESTGGDAILDLEASDPGRASRINFVSDGSAGDPTLSMVRINTFFRLNFAAGANEFEFQDDGDLVMTGTLTVNSDTTADTFPDYVFAPDYELMPLAEVEAFALANGHLPKIPSAAEVRINGLNMTQMQIALLEKVEELTLYTLQQQKLIEELQTALTAR